MDISIIAFPALNGDCFLINAGETNILIDGGYVNTYYEYLKPSLLELASQGKELSLAIVSHIDGDHISGILKFIEENENANIIPVGSIWHNTFRHLHQNEQKISSTKETYAFGDIKKENITSLDKEISASQGSSLGAMLLKYNYPWNTHSNGKAITVETGNPVLIDKNARIILLSPDNNKLKYLTRYWRRELYKNGYLDTSHSPEFWDDAFEFLLAQEKQELRYVEQQVSHQKSLNFHKLKVTPFVQDTSPTNGSSISFILQILDRTMLFLGDSHPDLIVEQLKKYFAKDEFPVFFDVIKLSHHGSFSNNSPELLEMIDSDKYIISTNGKTYNHPDAETLAWIITKKGSIQRKLYFNYPLDICNKLSSMELKKKYNYDIVLPENGNAIKIQF
jgi:beta-lactamase superfamily II metal-dependent hydrolase